MPRTTSVRGGRDGDPGVILPGRWEQQSEPPGSSCWVEPMLNCRLRATPTSFRWTKGCHRVTAVTWALSEGLTEPFSSRKKN